jgi:protein PhnA
MAKGYETNKVRLETIGIFGKSVGKRAGFTCEWCGGKDDLRLWDHKPDMEPNMETLALLCTRCRDLAHGRHAAPGELHSIRKALWNNTPSVAEGAARVLARCRETWARTAIEDSYIDDSVKSELLSQGKTAGQR